MKKIAIILLTLSVFAFFFIEIDFQKTARFGCAFCQEPVLQKQVFYRREGALGLLTHKPAVSGHVLIIPERHVERFEELSADELASIGEAIKEVDLIVRRAFGNTDYLLLQKNGRGVGQSVPHVHFHYLPASRFLAARFLISPWLKPLTADEIDKERLKLLNQALSESL